MENLLAVHRDAMEVMNENVRQHFGQGANGLFEEYRSRWNCGSLTWKI